jgi:hypothetical protein
MAAVRCEKTNQYTCFWRKRKLKRSLVVAIAAVLLASCGTAPELTHTPHVAQATEPSYVVGPVERTYLNDPAWPAFSAVYDSTRIEPQFIEMIRTTYEGEEFLVFFGAWCSDSERDLPRFLKIADGAGLPPAKITLYSLDRTKKSPDGLTARYGIEFVPTFIVLKDGVEVGRITESPRVSVEADLLTILVAARAK